MKWTKNGHWCSFYSYFWQTEESTMDIDNELKIQDISSNLFVYNKLLDRSINGWNDMGDFPMFLKKGWEDTLFYDDENLPELV